MERKVAEGLIPAGVHLERDLGRETVRFEPVLTAVEDLVPRVEVVEPGWLFVSIGGALRYFGGEADLVERLMKEVDVVSGGGGCFGVAEGPFAAYLAAKQAWERPESEPPIVIVPDDARFLSELDVAAIGSDDLVATFRWLGIDTLGALARLPRAAIASRFGTVGAHAHALASGEGGPSRPRAIPEELAVEKQFEEPLLLLEQVGFAARAAANALMELLDPHGVAPHRVLIEAEAGDGTVRSRVWRDNDPFTSTTLQERVWWQMRAWVESAGVPGGIVRLRLAPADLSGSGRQLGMFENIAAVMEAERAVSRVQALVGPDSVLEAKPVGGRNPWDRVQWRRWGEEEAESHSGSADSRSMYEPWPGRLPEPSPALVPPDPPLLDVEWEDGIPTRVRLGSRWEPVLNWAGPWRQVRAWWKGESPVDHYQIVTSVGAMLCAVTTTSDRLAIHIVGIYD